MLGLLDIVNDVLHIDVLVSHQPIFLLLQNFLMHKFFTLRNFKLSLLALNLLSERLTLMPLGVRLPIAPGTVGISDDPTLDCCNGRPLRLKMLHFIFIMV